MSRAAPVKYASHFTGQAQGFSPEGLYVKGGNPRKTPLTGEIAIYGWKPNYNAGSTPPAHPRTPPSDNLRICFPGGHSTVISVSSAPATP